MELAKYRKHPRVHRKRNAENSENTLTISGAAALGILGIVLAKGILLGYMLRKGLE